MIKEIIFYSSYFFITLQTMNDSRQKYFHHKDIFQAQRKISISLKMTNLNSMMKFSHNAWALAHNISWLSTTTWYLFKLYLIHQRRFRFFSYSILRNPINVMLLFIHIILVAVDPLICVLSNSFCQIELLKLLVVFWDFYIIIPSS